AVTGDLRVHAANGKIVVDRAEAAVAAKTANGDVRLGEVARGAVLAETALGKIEVGIRDGVTAWLDLNTSFGRVQSDLDDADRPRRDRPRHRRRDDVLAARSQRRWEDHHGPDPVDAPQP